MLGWFRASASRLSVANIRSLVATVRQPDVPKSLAGVCDVEVVAAPGVRVTTPPTLLIEVPHGATRRRHFMATRRRLTGEFPDDLEQFFYVNTDVGSIECARWVARMVTNPGAHPELEESLGGAVGAGCREVGAALILRGLVARTFIDCNRVIAGGPSSALREGLTPGLPAYVSRDGRRADAEGHAWRLPGRGGEGVRGRLRRGRHGPDPPHLRAALGCRSTASTRASSPALRRAYEPANYERWDRRPDVDLISETVGGDRLAPEAVVRALRERYARIGVEVAENATYRLHEATMGYVHSAKYPGRVLCMEINRELLADPFIPFVEMAISERKARRMAAPIAAALLMPEATKPAATRIGV